MLDRRVIAWALVAAGVVAVVAFYAAMPRIHGFEVHCDAAYSARRLAGDGWYAVRGAQLSAPAPMYNATDGTTLIVPGCGHGDGGVALRVRGDHRGFDRSGDRLLLGGHGVTGAFAGNLTTGGERSDAPRILEGTFEAHSLWGHAFLLGSGIVAAAAGLGLLHRGRPRAAWVLPVAAAAGGLVAHGLWASDLGLAIFFPGLPLLGLAPAIVGAIGLARWRSQASLVFLGLVVYAVAFWVTFVTFGGAYPLTPDA